LLGVDVNNLWRGNAVERGRVVRPVGSRTIDPDDVIRSKRLRKINGLLFAIGILPKNDIRIVAAYTIKDAGLGHLGRIAGVPLEGNFVGFIQTVKSSDREEDAPDISTLSVPGDVDDVGLQPSSLGNEGTAGFRHDYQLDRPIRKDRREMSVVGLL
jgi:hypothetical protein